MTYHLHDSKNKKVCLSPNYNFIFDKVTGFFARWGKTENEDPQFAPFPEICDMEISTICTQGCKFCYKGNTTVGENMSFDTFKIVFNKLPKSICQIAFGIGSLESHPQLFDILSYTRDNGVIPNITINGYNLTDELATKLANVCGAISVSYYDKDTCFDAIKKLTDRGMKQVNIHYMLSDETFSEALILMNEVREDSRTNKLNAIVFLQYKPKGNNIGKYHSISNPIKFKHILRLSETLEIGIGFDSCSAPMVLKGYELIKKDTSEIEKFIEPCESSLFSSYINVRGEFFPCSFSEGTPNWETGIDVKNTLDFTKEVWYNSRTIMFRETLLNTTKDCLCKFVSNCRKCPVYKSITNCEIK